MLCYLCCVESRPFMGYYCEDCSKIKRYINLYKSRVLEILDSVLSRDLEKQDNKIKLEIKNEIDVQTKKLQPIKEEITEEDDLQGSIKHYNNSKEVIAELKKKIKK